MAVATPNPRLRGANVPAAGGRTGPARGLLAAVAAALLHAACASGATEQPAPAAGWAGLALLAGFAVWCALSIAWSVAPDRSRAEVDRAVADVLVAGLGVVGDDVG